MSKDSTRNFGSPARVTLNSVVIFLFSQFVATAIIAAGILLTSSAGVLDKFNNSAPTQFFFVALAEGLAVWLVLKLLKKQKLSLRAIGLRRPHISDIWRGLVGFGIFYVLLIGATILLTFIFPGLNDTPQDVGFNNAAGIGELLAFLALVFLPPLGEEILVRGYLFSGLRSRLPFIKAALITSLLFSFAHLQLGDGAAPVWGAAAATFVLSLVLVYLREITGALYAGILVHMLNNLIAFFIKFH